MDDRNKSFWLGVFIIGALALVAWFFLFIKPHVGDAGLKLRVRFPNVERITPGTRVTYGGMPVGEVAKITTLEHPRMAKVDENGNFYMFELILRVDSSVQIFSYDEILFTSAGLMGEKSIAIIPKAPPLGGSAPVEVTHTVLYGQSADMLEQMVKGVTSVTETLQDSMTGFNDLLVTINEKEVIDKTLNTMSGFNDFLVHINETEAVDRTLHTMTCLHTLFDQALERGLVDQMMASFGSAERSFMIIGDVFERIGCGQGTLGKLLYSDSLYLQLSATLSKFSTVLNDISNFGLLFQYNKGWQRKRAQRVNQISSLCNPCDFYHVFDDEIASIQITLDRIGTLFETMKLKEVPIENPALKLSFCDLISRVEALQCHLKLYTEMMRDQYCQKCRPTEPIEPILMGSARQE